VSIGITLGIAMQNTDTKYLSNGFSRIVFSVVVFLFSIVIFSSPASAATYTVSKTADTNDGTCDADCSLREAVVAANANAGLDTIEFDISTGDSGYVAASGPTQAHWVLPLGLVLNLTDADGVFINGYSQAGASRNTADFGNTINTVLTIRIEQSASAIFMNITGSNNHITGLNVKTTSTPTGGNSLTVNSPSTNNWIEGNFFGTDITGTTTDQGWGSIIFNTSTSSNTVGTNGDGSGDVGERNLILLNMSTGNNGAVMSSSDSNIIAGNYIGVDKTGGICGTGQMRRQQVFVSNGNNNRVGTNLDSVSDSEEANIIGCVNTDLRTQLRISSDGGVFQGNYIGTNPQGDDLSGGFATPGIRDAGATTNTLIKKNIIANNGSFGIGLSIVGSTGVTFSQNNIFSNDALGIDLNADGQTQNDAGDIDTGNNSLMNYPVIQQVVKEDESTLIVTVDLDFALAEAPYTIEFFDNNAIDSSGYGEGQTYLGSAVTSSTGNGIELEVNLVGSAPTDPSNITATATNTSGSTSEFSAPPETEEYYVEPSDPPVDPGDDDSGSGSSSGSNSRRRSSSCSQTMPVGIPDLFQINRNGQDAILYFTPVSGHISGYHIIFGYSEGDERFGSLSEPGNHDPNLGVQSINVHELNKSTEYWFKILPLNGCAMGSWSNWLKAGVSQSKESIFYRYWSTVLKKASEVGVF
jgi:CSLREA domain-containing protein